AEENFPDLVKMLNEKKDLTETIEKGIDQLYASYLAKLKEKKKKG
ncbi:MAG: hypothetical protein HQL30_07215, partial [Candidatus Omnitrophica bacterium]|nr:hypothetical protein [Candidatus Omnitrophota bacterium]